MLTDKEMGVGNEDDEWPRGGRKASETHSSLSLDMSLSKALNPSEFLESSLGEIV